MIKEIAARIKQGYRTFDYPDGEPPRLSERFRGVPKIDKTLCDSLCRECADACPVDAIIPGTNPVIDLGKCLFCTDCVRVCPRGAITFSSDYRLSTSRREDLLCHPMANELELAREFDAPIKKILGRSLKLRQVSAGGCNACEADVNVLGTLAWDLGRFGIQFVASPRHADGLLVTGPVTKNMELALMKTWEAVPSPKIVILVGSCAISGGPFAGHQECLNGASSLLPIDLYVPGCPPHPLTILDGLLRLIGKVQK